jgi:COP9 signalosome complex subunit 8
MANGPPTPPPTTAAELQDEARASQPTSQATGSTPTVPPPAPPKQDSYQYIFPVIASLASQSNFTALIRTAEHSDLNVRLLFH